MAWINNMSMWTKLTAEGSMRMTNDRDQWRKYVYGVTNPRIKDG